MNREQRVEILVRYLDGNLSSQELKETETLLLNDADARTLLNELAEQAVMLADLNRAEAIRHSGGPLSIPIAALEHRNGLTNYRRTSILTLAMSAVLLVSMTVSALAYLASTKRSLAQVVKVTGASQYFGSDGKVENALKSGLRLVAGDSLESRSCDAWITMEVDDNASMTIAGHSKLRCQQQENNERRFELLKGSLWYSPATSPSKQPISVETPTLIIQFQDSLLNVQTSESESIVRVHSGIAHVIRRLDGRSIDVIAGHQLHLKLRDESMPVTRPQPEPIDNWSMRWMKGQEVLLGNWLPSSESERVRLGAAPLLWPLPDRESSVLYAVAVAAWKCSDRPVVLKGNSRLRFRGLTSKAQMVRIGVSTQKMYGVFAGKFEFDIPPSSLGKPGEYWEVEIPLSKFRPLNPTLASSPDGLELTDVYALTISEDAGLEISEIDLLR